MKWDIKSILSNTWIKSIILTIIILSNYSALFVFHPVHIDYIIDGSALYAISKTRMLDTPLILGKDIGYTYGPLTSLWGSVLPDSSFFIFGIGLFINILIVILTIYLLINLTKTMDAWRFWPLVMALAIFPLPDLSMSVFAAMIDVPWIQLGLLLAITSAYAPKEERIKNISLPLLALLSALGMFLKFTIGFHLFGILAIALLLHILSKANRSWIYAAIGIYIISLISIWYILTGGGIPSFFSYLIHGFITASNYSEFKIINLSSNLLYLFPIAILIINMIFSFYIGGFWLSLILLFNSFLFFKHGFVSADTHIFSFFAAEWFIMLCFAGMITAKKPKLALNVLFAFLMLVWFIGYVGMRFGVRPSPYMPTEIFTGLGKTASLVHPAKNFNDAKKQSIIYFSYLRERHKRLFDKLDKYCRPENTITFLPWELYFAELVKSRWLPIPTFQIFVSAYMPGFMIRDKAFFSGASSPDFIVLGQEGLDDRSPTEEMTHILPEILEHYEVIDKADGFLILKRRQIKLTLKYADYTGDLKGSKLIYIKTNNIKKQPWFELQKTIFKGPQFSIVLFLKDGKYVRYRVHATQLERGVFFSLPGINMEELFYPTQKNPIDGPVSIMFIPEVFTDICINKSPTLKIQTCYLTPVRTDARPGGAEQ